MGASIIKLKKNLNLVSYVYVEKLLYLKFRFGLMYVLVHFTMLGPKYIELISNIEHFNMTSIWPITFEMIH
jgi:hypothetical protein